MVTFGRSKSSSGSRRNGRPKKARSPRAAAADRPVAPRVLAAARRIAERYQVVLWFEDGEWYGRGVEMPMAMGDGATPDECVTATREAFAAAVAYMLESGEPVPPPASEGKRTEQINVRLTAEEKLALEAAYQQFGYRGVSDFVRAAALLAARKPPAEVDRSVR